MFDLVAVHADGTSVRIFIELLENPVGLRMASHGVPEAKFEADNLFKCL